MVTVIIKIDEEGPRVISLGAENAMKAQLFNIIMASETGVHKFETDLGYGIRVNNGEKVVKYILQTLHDGESEE